MKWKIPLDGTVAFRSGIFHQMVPVLTLNFTEFQKTESKELGGNNRRKKKTLRKAEEKEGRCF
jgi:hypothetical protein